MANCTRARVPRSLTTGPRSQRDPTVRFERGSELARDAAGLRRRQPATWSDLANEDGRIRRGFRLRTLNGRRSHFVVVGDDELGNGARRCSTGKRDGEYRDRVDDWKRKREGEKVEKTRQLTTNVTERSVKHGEARGGRNRRRRLAEVSAVN